MTTENPSVAVPALEMRGITKRYPGVVANDHINNPGAINAIFGLGARLEQAADERMAGEAQLLAGGAASKVPHILKDGADSVGIAGAAIRVYVNEGLYSQQWLTDHDILIGLRRQRPFSVANAFENSVYWQATWERLENVANSQNYVAFKTVDRNGDGLIQESEWDGFRTRITSMAQDHGLLAIRPDGRGDGSVPRMRVNRRPSGTTRGCAPSSGWGRAGGR